MTDPKRLIETDLHDATSVCERELVGSLRPSGEARTAVWRRIAGQGAIAATVAATAGTAALEASAATSAGVQGATAVAAGKAAAATTAGVTASLATKAGLALIVAAPVLGGVVYLTETAPTREQPAAMADRPQAAGTGDNLEDTPTRAVPPGDQAEPPIVASPAPASAEMQAKQDPDMLREENQLLREARAQERAGNPKQALSILADLDRRFAAGALGQEREVLRIQALSAAGSVSAAKARAKRFLTRYPNSPYAAHVHTVLQSEGL